MNPEYRLSYTANEIDEKLGKIDILEEALANAGGGSGSGIAEAVLLANITTTEEITHFLLEFDGDKYTDLYIYMEIHATATNAENYNRNVEIKFNNDADNSFAGACLFTGAIAQYGKWGNAHISIMKNLSVLQSAMSDSNMAFNVKYITWNNINTQIAADGLKKIRIQSQTGALAFGVGTQLKIYGIRA